VVLMDPVGGTCSFVDNRKKRGILDLPKLYACGVPDVFDSGFSWDGARVDISLAKLRIQFDERSVSVCDTVDRLRFQERVVYTVTTTVQEMRRKPLMK
jgi:hypothetical protein